MTAQSNLQQKLCLEQRSSFEQSPVKLHFNECNRFNAHAGGMKDLPTFLMQPVVRARLSYASRAVYQDKQKPGETEPPKSKDVIRIERIFNAATTDPGERYAYQPAYYGARMLYDTDKEILYSQYGSPMAEEKNPLLREWKSTIRDAVQTEKMWLEVMPTTVYKPRGHTGQLIILDLIEDSITYDARRAILEEYFFELGVKDAPEWGSVNLVPEYTNKRADQLFFGLARMNIEWNYPVYRGVVAIRRNGHFLKQSKFRDTTTSNREFFPLSGIDGF